MSGFAHTIQAYNFIIILDSHTQDQIPIDVGRDASAAPANFVTNAEAWDHVITLLDQGATELQGTAFPFLLPPGLTGFDTPATFLTFNRALRARVAVYRGDYTDALTFLSQSFLEHRRCRWIVACTWTSATGPGDFANPLAINPTNRRESAVTPRSKLRLSSSPEAHATAAISRS